MSTQPDQTKRFFSNTAYMDTQSIKAITAEGKQFVADMRAARERRDMLRAQANFQALDIDLAALERAIVKVAHPLIWKDSQ